jgi:hypothetical protein
MARDSSNLPPGVSPFDPHINPPDDSNNAEVELEDLLDEHGNLWLLETMQELCEHKADHHGAMHTPLNRLFERKWRHRAIEFSVLVELEKQRG